MSEERNDFINWWDDTLIKWWRDKPACPHIPRCFEKSDGCWNYDEAKKRVDAYPNFP